MNTYILILLFAKVSWSYLQVAAVMADCKSSRYAGVVVVNDCQTVISTFRTDRDQDIEIYQDPWKLTWWKDDGAWENITVFGPDNFDELLTLNKNPHIANTGIEIYTDFGVACTNSDIREYCETQQMGNLDKLVSLGDLPC